MRVKLRHPIKQLFSLDSNTDAVKPHPGQNRVAARLRMDLQLHGEALRNDSRLRDRYSLCCVPHVIGVLEDALPWLRQTSVLMCILVF